MANIVGFQTQLVSVMEVLANAAVAEICKLVEDNYTSFQLEISKRQKENEVLKRRVQMMEIQRSYYRRVCKLKGLTGPPKERSIRVESQLNYSHSDDLSQHLGADGIETLYFGPDDTSVPPTSRKEEEKSLGLFVIKEERADDPRNSSTKGELSISEKEVNINYVDRDMSSTNSREELADQSAAGPCEQECGVQAEFLEDDYLKEHIAVARKHTLKLEDSRAQNEGRRSNPASHVKLDQVPYPEWDPRVFDAVDQTDIYTRAEFDAGTSSSQYPLQRGVVDPVCSCDVHISQKGQFVPGGDGNFNHPELGGRDCEVEGVSQSIINNMPPCGHSVEPFVHPAVHQMEKNVCKHCGKSFSYPSTLMLHQRVHTGERPHSCSLCGKRFSTMSSLKKHQSIHTGEKPFRCQHCGKQFADPSNLKKHLNVHTGRRPFSCSQCGKTFNQSSNLKTHMKIHTGEKPFGCDYCGQIFAYKTSLMKHQLKNCLGPKNIA